LFLLVLRRRGQRWGERRGLLFALPTTRGVGVGVKRPYVVAGKLGGVKHRPVRGVQARGCLLLSSLDTVAAGDLARRGSVGVRAARLVRLLRRARRVALARATCVGFHTASADKGCATRRGDRSCVRERVVALVKREREGGQ